MFLHNLYVEIIGTQAFIARAYFKLRLNNYTCETFFPQLLRGKCFHDNFNCETK